MKQHSATSRLKQDYVRLKRDPLPYIVAEPLPSNILEWHYVVQGPEHSFYKGGYYHGKLLFPAEFPFKPPSIFMITPNGRFKPNTRLCLSISDFHPDTWNPAWSVSTILTGLLSFMLEKSPTLGSVETTDEEKRYLAKQSLQFNLKNKVFVELFPDIVQQIQEELKHQQENALQAAAVTAQTEVPSNVADRPSPPLGRNQWFHMDLTGVVTNVVVIMGIMMFAFVVTYVVNSSNIG